MQNKPNFRKTKMNLNSYLTTDYENERLADTGKTKPIQSQYKAKTNPIPEKPKMNENLFATKVYENITTFRPQKNKANTNPIQTQPVVSLPRFFGPFAYFALADDFILYSVGPNFKDDGGELGKDKKGKVRLWADNGDWVFWPVRK